MGAGLFERFPELTAQANDVLGYDLSLLCLEDPDHRLDDTRCTQPALYVVNALSYLDSLNEGEAAGDFLLGHSLGEYNALFAAGAFDFETGLKLVIKRGELMAQSRGGAMLAVLGLSEAELRDFLVRHALPELDVANLNTPTQSVLSGPEDDIARAHQLLESERLRVAPLRASAAFHSRYMESARDEFACFLKGFRFAPLRRTVIANFTARPYEDQDIAGTLSAQIAGPVRWVESIRYVLRQGAAAECRAVGNGKALTRMVRQIETAPADGTAPARSVPAAEAAGPAVPAVPGGVRPRLFCVAYAGGDERAYVGLSEECPGLDVVTLERPGHGRRISETLLHDPEQIVDDLLAQIRGRLDAPYAVYGHSLGARLAFMLCRRLRGEGLPAPRHLFVSGECGPALPSRERDTWKLSTDAFWDHLKQLGGLPPELLQFEDLMNFYERILRADFAALGAYTYEADAPLDLPVTAMTGDEEWFTQSEIEAWQHETTQPLNTYRFPGGHFFIRAHWPALGKIFVSGFEPE